MKPNAAVRLAVWSMYAGWAIGMVAVTLYYGALPDLSSIPSAILDLGALSISGWFFGAFPGVLVGWFSGMAIHRLMDGVPFPAKREDVTLQETALYIVPMVMTFLMVIVDIVIVERLFELNYMASGMGAGLLIPPILAALGMPFLVQAYLNRYWQQSERLYNDINQTTEKSKRKVEDLLQEGESLEDLVIDETDSVLEQRR